VNSRGVVAVDNTIARTFLGIFVRGGGSGGNRFFSNTISAGANGELGICYNPSPVEGATDGPSGNLVYANLISGFNRGIQTNNGTYNNVYKENTIAYLTEAIQERGPGSRAGGVAPAPPLHALPGDEFGERVNSVPVVAMNHYRQDFTAGGNRTTHNPPRIAPQPAARLG
jgi:hypothetical protein